MIKFINLYDFKINKIRSTIGKCKCNLPYNIIIVRNIFLKGLIKKYYQ